MIPSRRRSPGPGWARLSSSFLLLLAGCLLPAAGRPDMYLSDMWDEGTVEGGPIFPNYTKLLVEDATINFTVDTPGSPENIKGITVVNFGTATNADIKGVYAVMQCGATTTGTLTLTYAGVYTEDVGNLPAWTWAGTSPDFSACADLCTPCTVGVNCCGGGIGIQVYADIAACPTNLATVNMGFPIQTISDTSWGGSVADNWDTYVPWGEVHPTSDYTIYYIFKEGPKSAAPGDTVMFTMYYGRPGANPLTSIVVYDTLPPFTHYIPGSAAPAADAGFDPNVGPPMGLQWSFAGPIATTGGPTGMITFQVTVDWGNGEAFEPGSGDVGAPEGARLANMAAGIFNGTTCGTKAYYTNPVTTTVKRFLFYMVGDNDLLFASKPGQPSDQITYTVFIKNVSTKKTWWNVDVWDSVPPEINPWIDQCGFYDPCTGWTMTPSGCAAYSPGYKVNGAKTLLTWRLDMPPGMTLQLAWMGEVKNTVAQGSTAVNLLAIYENGRTSISAGTGASGVAARFTHLAPVVLQTTYISYVSYMAGSDDKGNCPGYYISFFPLNKRNQFELYGIQYAGAGWSTTGGVSQSIGCQIGDCLNGFPGNAGCTLGTGIPGITGGGTPGPGGCGPGRVPTTYDPSGFIGVCPPAYGFSPIYKIVTNAPLLWQILSHIPVANPEQDFHTFAPSSTLTYRGFLHYTWRGEVPGMESLDIFNTSMDPYNAIDTTLLTTVHLFRYNYVSREWDYVAWYDIGPEGHAADLSDTAADYAPWRVLSSQAAVIVCAEWQLWDTLSCCCCMCADNVGAFSPNRENGFQVNTPGQPACFYGIVQPKGCQNYAQAVITNMGAVDAQVTIQTYLPDSTIGDPAIPVNLRDTGGTWITKGNYTVPWGFNDPGNPLHLDGPPFAGTGTTVFRAKLTSGGPIQIIHGAAVWQWWSGGSVLHASSGKQLGNNFWISPTGCPTCKNAFQKLFGFEVFCSKSGTKAQCKSETGYSAAYTTNGPDQCVLFTGITAIAKGQKCNYQITVTGGAALALFNCDRITEKGYTAPFLALGTHYEIILPPVAYVGTPIWLTIVVVDASADTKTDYCGTISFTSTDPTATMGGNPMDAYNFTFSSTLACNVVPNEDGVKIFVNVVFNRLGFQTIVANDTNDGSITGLAALQVVGVDIKLTKLPRLAIVASADTVQFKICWSNYSSASAFTVVLTDAAPVGTTFLPEAAAANLSCGNTEGVALAVAYSTLTTATPPPAASFATANPIAGTRWLRWTIPVAGIQTTGCACFRITVN